MNQLSEILLQYSPDCQAKIFPGSGARFFTVSNHPGSPPRPGFKHETIGNRSPESLKNSGFRGCVIITIGYFMSEENKQTGGSPDICRGPSGQEVSLAASGLVGMFLATRFTRTSKQTSVRADSSHPRRPSTQTETSCCFATRTIELSALPSVHLETGTSQPNESVLVCKL